MGNKDLNIKFHHRFLDKHKPYPATDILTVDVDNDNRVDVVCGKWWYKNPTWERFDIPGIFQVINAYDIDNDGKVELIAIKGNGFSSNLCFLKPIDPINNRWEEYPIGTGCGDWPHGSLIAPILPNKKLGLIINYHSANPIYNHKNKDMDYPELFLIPDVPTQDIWPKKTFAQVLCSEEVNACDINGNGLLDVVSGPYWFENLGNGIFSPHCIKENLDAARINTADINGNGRKDIIVGEQTLDSNAKTTPLARLAWLENPDGSKNGEWKIHVIDKLKCPHSLDVYDIDNDGEIEIICAEHEPKKLFSNKSRVSIYKKADKEGKKWHCHLLENSFEHHCGTKVFEIEKGRLGIVSHGWIDKSYVHLWEVC